MIEKRLQLRHGLVVLAIVSVALVGCIDLASLTGGSAGGSATPSDGSETGGGPDGGELSPGAPLRSAGTVAARIRNFSDLSADVSLRFLLKGFVVRLSFLRVPAHTSTTAIGPDLAERIEASGVNENNEALPEVAFLFGVDFDDGSEAVYVIGDTMPDNVPPTLAFVEPAGDLEVLQGASFAVVITDEDPDSSAAIDFYLDPDDRALDGDETVLAAGLPEDPDGTADTFSFAVPQDLSLGFHRLVAVISDELSTDIVQAPGRIRVLPAVSPGPEAAVAFRLVEPAWNVEVVAGGSFTASWTDLAPEDNAAIAIYLDPNEADFDGDELLLASGIAEDPDRAGDRIVLLVPDVPPGAYRVLGRLTSTVGTATSAAPGRLIVVPPGEPALAILQPAEDVTVEIGDHLFVAWDDLNLGRNAEITFYLDPDGIDLDGGETRLAAFAEDPDGPGFDDAQIAIGKVTPGTYDLLGVMFDGLVTVTARARGRVTVQKVSGPPPGGGGWQGPDCQPNGIPDDQELEGNDCNSNRVPDECDIADGTSTDGNGNGVPDLCEAGLTGYWRFDFWSDLGCGDTEQVIHELRYLGFDQGNHLVEKWIPVDGDCLDQDLDQVYFKINYPSTGGPSYIRYRQDCELTDNIDRTITVQTYNAFDHRVHIEELTSLVGSGDGESGTGLLDGMMAVTIDTSGNILSVGMEGYWEFDSAEELICGHFSGLKVASPPERPCIIDLEAVGLTLDRTDLTSPGTVQVSSRDYRVRYSFLSRPVEVRYVLSSSLPPKGTGDEVVLGSEWIDPGPDGMLDLHGGSGPTLDVPPNLDPSCDYQLLMVIDPDGAAAETDEDNNVRAVPVTVSGNGIPHCGTGEQN